MNDALLKTLKLLKLSGLPGVSRSVCMRARSNNLAMPNSLKLLLQMNSVVRNERLLARRVKPALLP